MDRNNKPVRREKNVGNGSGGFSGRRGSGLGSGPVGNSGAHSGRGGSSSGGKRSGGGSRSPLSIIIVILVLLFGGGGSALNFLGGGASSDSSSGYTSGSTSSGSGMSSSLSAIMNAAGTGSALGGSTSGSGWLSGNILPADNDLDTAVASSAREKRTQIIGRGADQITLMIYMCGTDLESRSGMATSDLQEILKASSSENLNILVFTGGTTKWNNNVVSGKKNQIYQIVNGKMKLQAETDQMKAMTDPDTLSGFIKWSAENYPANRYDLILWDHGGGSISGYGYDEAVRSGSMTLDKISKALKNGGVELDFIGFDACLMATLETAIACEPYADYMIASEETEPGIGWYYTDWVSALAEDPSMETVKTGKLIVDGFVDTCASKVPGQQTTLSVTDLAELAGTVPEALSAFAGNMNEMVRGDDYQTVAGARKNAKEFAASSAIDQVDLVHMASLLGTDEGKEMAEVVRSAVKYNRTSRNVSNAYGLSIYFPLNKKSKVSEMMSTYDAIGVDSAYGECIRSFATMTTGGQAASGGSTAQMSTLFDLLGQGGSSFGSAYGDPAELLAQLLTGRNLDSVGLDKNSADFLDMDLLKEKKDDITGSVIDGSQLAWQDKDGTPVIKLSDANWDKISKIELNVFVDDGAGYVDLGLDNVYEFDEDGDLLGYYDGTWLAINGQNVAYYLVSADGTQDDYTIMGRVPAYLNDVRVDLMLAFTSAHPNGEVLGAHVVYKDGETQTDAKGLIELQDGDRIDFVCDCYDYDFNYEDSYYLGEPLVVDGALEITNEPLGEDIDAMAAYLVTDLYEQGHWTMPLSAK